jgi:hypothetical protein
VYIVEVLTRAGKICEKFPSYELARRRVMRLREEDLAGIPFIFQELPDGSQRLVREDGKPLQWHRLPDHEDRLEDDAPLPLADSDGSLLDRMKIIERRENPEDGWGEA